MTSRPRNLTSDPDAERLARRPFSDADLRAVDARSGGDPRRAPRSLEEAGLEADDEQIAANDDWDDPSRL